MSAIPGSAGKKKRLQLEAFVSSEATNRVVAESFGFPILRCLFVFQTACILLNAAFRQRARDQKCGVKCLLCLTSLKIFFTSESQTPECTDIVTYLLHFAAAAALIHLEIINPWINVFFFIKNPKHNIIKASGKKENKQTKKPHTTLSQPKPWRGMILLHSNIVREKDGSLLINVTTFEYLNT